LIVSEGDFWLRQRRLMQPSFHLERIAGYGQVMVAYAQFVADWRSGEVKAMLRLRRAVRHLDALVYEVLAERRAGGQDRGDLLSLLLQARDADDDSSMSDRQLHDEVLTLVLGGHETTALALTCTWYLLAEHPEVEARLPEELIACCRAWRCTAARSYSSARRPIHRDGRFSRNRMRSASSDGGAQRLPRCVLPATPLRSLKAHFC
jgi:cytochrome P450